VGFRDDVWLDVQGSPLTNRGKMTERFRRPNYGTLQIDVTIEDLVEEIVGDISDEYDIQAREAVEVGGVLELAGSLSLVDVRSDHGIPIPEGSWTTLGGFVFARLGRLPKVGDKVTIPQGEFDVVAMDGRRVAAVRFRRMPVVISP
jgi:putative hemolysin